MREYTEKLLEKLRESTAAVLPIAGIVLVLCFALVPVPSGILLCFLAGAVLLTVGMMFFNLGAEMAMSPIGERVGPAMTKSRKLWVVLVLAFLLGVIITVSEPDLQVLAELVPSVPNEVLILFVAAGVGVFLAIAILRMLFGIALPVMLVGFYALVFFLAFLVPEGFRSVAFDSGGVTTGPMTVPFIMALGVGISAVRNDRHAADDSFGLVGLCSIGPILAVMVLGMIYHPAEGNYELEAMKNIEDSMELAKQFLGGFPVYLKEMMISLLPIVLAFGLFQLFSERLPGKELKRIGIGVYIRRAGTFHDGSQHGLYAGRPVSRSGHGGPFGQLAYRSRGSSHGLFHCKSGACSLCAESSGGGNHRRRDPGESHGNQPFPWRGGLCGPLYGARPHRPSDSLFPGSGLRHCHRPFLLCAENLYGDRL